MYDEIIKTNDKDGLLVGGGGAYCRGVTIINMYEGPLEPRSRPHTIPGWRSFLVMLHKVDVPLENSVLQLAIRRPPISVTSFDKPTLVLKINSVLVFHFTTLFLVGIIHAVTTIIQREEKTNERVALTDRGRGTGTRTRILGQNSFISMQFSDKKVIQIRAFQAQLWS